MRPGKVREVAAWRRIDLAELPCRYGIGRLSAELYPSEGLELLLRVYLPEGAQPPHRDALRVGFVDGDSRTLIEVRDHSVTLRVHSAEPGVLDVELCCRTPTAQDALRLLGLRAGETPDVEISIATRRAAQFGNWRWVDGGLRCVGRFDVETPARDRYYARLTVRVGEEQLALSVPSSFTGPVAMADRVK